MVPFLCDVLKDLLTSFWNVLFVLSGRCKNINAIVQTKNILQETIQWINDITDTCFTDFFQRWSSERVFWKYAANLPENTDAEVRFQ